MKGSHEMSAWGNKLFDDDTACDVRDDYVRLLSEGHAGPAATDLLSDRWQDSLADEDEGPVFWLALAVTQHKYGRLEARVKERALAVLDQDLGLERWREIGAHSLRGRQKQLEKVRVQLDAPQPREKRIAPPFKDSCTWEAGEVIAYRLNSGKLALFHVLGTETHAKGVSPVCELLDWNKSEPPSPTAVASIGVRRGVVPPETMLSALAVTDPEYQTNPSVAMQRLLANIGLIKLTGGQNELDPANLGAVTRTIYQLKTGNRDVTEKVRRYARQHKPALLEPVAQVSLRRELKKSELPAHRVQPLGIRRPNSPALGEWLVIRWYEMDQALADLFGLK
jgi:hypothetical protein